MTKQESQLPPQIEMSDIQDDILRRGDEQAARNRLNEYARAWNLEESDANFRIIKDYVDEHGGYWSAETVDQAMNVVGASLSRKPAPPPPEQLEMLPDGTQQLPLDKPVPWNASKAQAKDWLARHRETHKYQRASSSFGSKF